MTKLRVLMIVLACGAGIVWPGRIRAEAEVPAGGGATSDPIRCWWQTDKGAVQIGERFTLTITCGVSETPGSTTVPVANQFEPTALQVAPFEVLGSEHHEDVHAPSWRYFQYDYTLRLVSDEYFGKDVDVPSIKITYNIQAASSGGAGGLEHTYTLPAIPVRILSLVPGKAGDIREGSGARFGDFETRRFHAIAERVAAAICFAFALVLVGSALARVTGRQWRRAPGSARALPWWTVLGGCLRSLTGVKEDVARDGWTQEFAGQALAALRIAGAVALDRPLAQARVDAHRAGRPGQLVLQTGILRAKRAVISASTTGAMIDASLTNGNGAAARLDPRAQAALEHLRDSLRTFNVARYARNGDLDATALDAALEHGVEAVRRFRLMKLWPTRSAGIGASAR